MAGGALLPGRPQRLTAVLANYAGFQLASRSLTLTDNRGDTVATALTSASGYASFDFVPDKGRRYSVRFTDEGVDRSFEAPQVNPKALRIDAAVDDFAEGDAFFLQTLKGKKNDAFSASIRIDDETFPAASVDRRLRLVRNRYTEATATIDDTPTMDNRDLRRQKSHIPRPRRQLPPDGRHHRSQRRHLPFLAHKSHQLRQILTFGEI